jgi:hypothetical protein
MDSDHAQMQLSMVALSPQPQALQQVKSTSSNNNVNASMCQAKGPRGSTTIPN